VCGPQEDHYEKDVKSKVAANKKWPDGRLMAKILIVTIQVNLVPNPSEMWRRQHVVIKFFAISLPSSHFLAATLDFISVAFLGAAHLFYSWAVLDWIKILLKLYQSHYRL